MKKDELLHTLSKCINKEIINYMIYISDIYQLTIKNIIYLCDVLSIEHTFNSKTNANNIVRELMKYNFCMIAVGLLDITEDFGFIRMKFNNYIPSIHDVYVSKNNIIKYMLKKGDLIICHTALNLDNTKNIYLNNIIKINNINIKDIDIKDDFEYLTPIHPNQQIKLSLKYTQNDPYLFSTITRLIDIIAPIGKGQRGLIVAPPKSGKTIILQSIAKAIITNHPDIILIILLIDERPEEVTEMQCFQCESCEVFASSFDSSSQKHIYISELVLEKSKRLVELGKNVFILLDSITRLTRAYNSNTPMSGKILSGGVDINALQKPKRFFGAARNTKEAGSLTIIATALIETGSKMDEVIFEEFKGTGNMEIVLDRKIAEVKQYPAIDINKSGTRKEEILIHNKDNLQKIWLIRKAIANISQIEANQLIISKINNTKDNQEFLSLVTS